MAKRFTFRFDTLLKIRQQREDERKRVVASRLREIERLDSQIGQMYQQIEVETETMRKSQEYGTIDLQQAVSRRHWMSHLHKTILETEAQKRVLEAKLAQERLALAEAAKHRRVLEKLRERQEERHDQTEQRLEMKESDEMATLRYVYDQEEQQETNTAKVTP